MPKPDLPFNILFNKERQIIFQRNYTGEVGKGRIWKLRCWVRKPVLNGEPAGTQPLGGVCLEKQRDRITFQKDNLAGALVRDEGTGGNGNGAVDGDL